MTADDDRLDPPGDGPRDALKDDRFAEDSAAEDIADLCANATSEAKSRDETNTARETYGAIW